MYSDDLDRLTIEVGGELNFEENTHEETHEELRDQVWHEIKCP